MYIYKMVNLLKSNDNLHGIRYRIKIMLNGIAIIKLNLSTLSSFHLLNVIIDLCLFITCFGNIALLNFVLIVIYKYSNIVNIIIAIFSK